MSLSTLAKESSTRHRQSWNQNALTNYKDIGSKRCLGIDHALDVSSSTDKCLSTRVWHFDFSTVYFSYFWKVVSRSMMQSSVSKTVSDIEICSILEQDLRSFCLSVERLSESVHYLNSDQFLCDDSTNQRSFVRRRVLRIYFGASLDKKLTWKEYFERKENKLLTSVTRTEPDTTAICKAVLPNTAGAYSKSAPYRINTFVKKTLLIMTIQDFEIPQRNGLRLDELRVATRNHHEHQMWHWG